jgi:hypothetical protein
MVFTTHAQKRMTERGIAKGTVIAVLIHGEERLRDDGLKEYAFCGIRVVTSSASNDDCVVVTAFHEDIPRRNPRKTPKRGTKKEAGRMRRSFVCA